MGLAGPNGSGKTTLLHCLTGYLDAASGTVELDSKKVSALGRRQVAERVAFVPQKTESAFSFSTLQMVLMGRHPYAGFSACDSAEDVDLALAALRRLDIEALAERQFEQLSGGEKQLVLLARALAQQAPLLVLDEPLTGLDMRHQHELMAAVHSITRESGRGALATFHDLQIAARWCDRLILLHGGTVVADGPPLEVITPENLKILYGVEAEVRSDYSDRSVFLSIVRTSSGASS